MSDKIKQLAPQIWSEIQKANHILLCCHVRPDLDSVGSNLAMKLTLDSLGKQSTLISGDDPPLDSVKFLKSFEEIESRSFPQTELQDYDLFISIDISAPSQITRQTELRFPIGIKTINIDHHKTNISFGDINLVENKMISSSEMAYQLIYQNNPELINSDIATCLFVGIWGDSGGFKFEGTTSETFATASDLVKRGAESWQSVSKLTQIGFKNILVFGKTLSLAQNYFNGGVVITKIPLSYFLEQDITGEKVSDTKNTVAFFLSQCTEAVITAVIYEYEPRRINISLRSNTPNKFLDVTKIATAFAVGGGHARAAGAKIENSTVDEAEKEILKTIQKIYPDLGQP